MKCSYIEENIIDIIEGNLSAEALGSSREHIRTCKKCMHLQKNISHVWNEKNDLLCIKPFPDFYYRIEEKLQKKTQFPNLINDFFQNWQPILRPAVAAIITVSAIWFGAFLGNSRSISESQTSLTPLFEESYSNVFREVPEGTVGDFYFISSDNMEEVVQ